MAKQASQLLEHEAEARKHRAKKLVHIRLQFDDLADKFGIQAREVDRAMASIDDTISDLIYEVEGELEGEIIDSHDTDI